MGERGRRALLALGMGLVASSGSLAGEPGVPLASAPTARVRPGLWTVSEVLNGRKGEGRSVCIGDRKIGVPQLPKCERYKGRFIAPNTYVISGACPDGPLTRMQDRRVIAGDLQHAFIVTTDLTDAGFHNSQMHSVSSYRFAGPCPAGMRAQNGGFF